MLGFYEPLAKGPAAHMAGPLAQWKTDSRQPTFERVNEVERLAIKQRMIIAAGGAPVGHMVGTAEIVSAMGNLHRDIGTPKAHLELFQWATADVLCILTGDTPEATFRAKGWPLITDDDVLRPTGRRYATYQDTATRLRRSVINEMEGAPDNPRVNLRPLAAHFLEMHEKFLAEARAEGLDHLVKPTEDAIATIRGMYPGLRGGIEEGAGT